MTDRAIVSKDSTIHDAYRDAVKQAEWDYGHDAYNGTISTTGGVKCKTSRLEAFIKEHGKSGGFSLWYDTAFGATEKWGDVWGARVPEHAMSEEEREVHEKNNTKRYIFAGWASC